MIPASVREAEVFIATEIELKLAARPADLPRLKQALAGMAENASAARRQLVSTYYDTPDLVLQRQGLSLRVRAVEGRFVQTVKAGGRPGTDWLERGEWEDMIPGTCPQCDAPTSGRHLPPGLGDDLRPLFTTEITRHSATIASGATRIEAAIDEGAIKGAAGVEPIGEIELELKSGRRAALYDTALRLFDVASLRIETRSKAERGYRLAAGGPGSAAAVHAAPVALDRAMRPEDALQRIGLACLAHLLRNEPAVLAGDPEGVHQMRVAGRRLRSALSAFKEALPAGERRRVAAALKGLAGGLAAARNLDVLADGLLPPARAALSDERDLDHLAAAVDWARRRAHQQVRDEVLSPHYTATMLRLLRWFEAGPLTLSASDGAAPPARIGDLAPRLLDRRWRAVRKRSEGFRRQDAAARHRLRIAVKKLRYTIETLGSLFGDDSKDFVKSLRRLQDALGDANDVRMAGDVLAELCAPAEPQSRLSRAGAQVLAWHRQRLAGRERKLRKRLRRLNRAVPFWRGREAGPADGTA